MSSLLKIIVILISLTLLVAGGILKHDDLIIAAGDQLQFLINGSESRTLTLDSYNASKFSALSYDVTTRNLFFSDRRHRYGHIFSVKLGEESRHHVQQIVEKNSNETVENLTYDAVDQILLWTDGFNRSIRRVHIDHDTNNQLKSDNAAAVEVVHFLNNEDKPRGLVADPCTRKIYWTNRYMPHPTIERSHLNGSQREIIVEADLLLPNALDVDVDEQIIYWADNNRMGYFRIEKSFVNGTGRQEIYRGIGQFVVSLAVGSDYVYWSDYDHKNVWCTPKDGSSKNPIILRKFSQPVMSLVVFRHEPFNCRHFSSAETTSSLADYKDVDFCLGFCYNKGQCNILVVDSHSLRCSCLPGYSGDRCELVVEKCTVGTKHHNRWEIVSLVCLTTVCIILLLAVTKLSLQLMKLMRNKKVKVFKRRVLKRPSNSGPVEDLDNCCNSFTLCERSAAVLAINNRENSSWKDDGRDCATLLKCEF